MSSKLSVALLCGRSGSASVLGKNTYPVLGRPLMYYTLAAVKQSDRIGAVFVSTDCPKIKATAIQHGVDVIDRPAELSSATAQHVDTLIHALLALSEKDIHPDYLAVMMCNCGTFRKGLVDECIRKLDADPNADSCVTGIVENDHHPYRVKRMRDDGYLGSWIDLSEIDVSTNRQDLPPCYILDHALWVLRVASCFPPKGQKPWRFMGNNILFVNNEGSRDVHSADDLLYTEEYLKRQGWEYEKNAVTDEP